MKIACGLCGDNYPLHEINFEVDPRASVAGQGERQFICDPCLARANNEVYDAMSRATFERVKDAPEETINATA